MRDKLAEWGIRRTKNKSHVLEAVREAHKGTAEPYTIHTVYRRLAVPLGNSQDQIDVYPNGEGSAVILCYNNSKLTGRGLTDLGRGRWIQFELQPA